MEKIKTNTVLSKWCRGRSDRRVPFIGFWGAWLESYGFVVGQHLEIYSPGRAQLLLKGITRTEDSTDRKGSNGHAKKHSKEVI